MIMQESKVQLTYPFGNIDGTVRVDGQNLDRPQELATAMASAINIALAAEVLHQGLANGHIGEGRYEERCFASVEVGDGIKSEIQLNFSFGRDVSKKTINDMFFGASLPTAYEAADMVLGNGPSSLTNPSSPWMPVPHQDIVDQAKSLVTGSPRPSYLRDTALGQHSLIEQARQIPARARELVGGGRRT